MDENDYVCPLCCEELDISDRQFFPCKCGYQVCMWCWHRIRESESGLCPACRTPYGDDPHEFSAVDVEEVLKANKEKEAAAKRERLRQNQQQQGHHHQQQLQQQPQHPGGLSSSDGDGEGSHPAGGARGPMDVPKDRTQLANMRVIRRNLVYAVGLPPTIASEDTLRKPEYFGQYGKIVKMVLNRSQTTGDPRRASASAYVTFAHKEDTLACILAMDGFYLDGRNIRASYGTSKYCSAFIKNVRCNNPECTYLHEMGDMEDTFTKQEIQAGYVTSGRDVLARQQQIMAQALSATLAGSGGPPRRRTGGGGPSGTGKACSSPVFPPPTFDEAVKSSVSNLVPPPSGMLRSASAGNSPVPAGTKMVRSATLGQGPSAGVVKAASSSQHSLMAASRKAPAASANSLASHVTTAASVVAGVHANSGVAPEPPPPHTTLTPLTPLKRAAQKASKAISINESEISPGIQIPKSVISTERGSGKEVEKLPSVRNGSKTTLRPSQGVIGTAPTSPSSSISSSSGHFTGRLAPLDCDVGHSIGGSLLPAPGPRFENPSYAVGERNCGLIGANDLASGVMSNPRENELLGGATIGTLGSSGLGLTGSLGGDIFTGPLHNPGAAIGSGKDKWNTPSHIGSTAIGTGVGEFPRNNGLWGDSAFPMGASQSTSSAGVIGGRAPGSSLSNHGAIGSRHSNSHNAGSSALASMLGISLPTGSGTLHESSSFWGLPTPSSTMVEHSSVASAFGVGAPSQGVIGPGPKPSSGVIGGVTINRAPGSGSLGSQNGPGSSNSDIALLQSLLPGVHITSGNVHSSSAGYGLIGHDWSSSGGGGGLTHRFVGGGDSFGVNAGSNWSTNAIGNAGTIGQRNTTTNRPKEREANTSIW